MQSVHKGMKYDILLFVGLMVGFAALGGFISHVEAQTQTNGEHRQTFCPAVYQPVCGALDVQCITTPCPPVLETYGNTCELERAGARFYHSGACKPGERYQSDTTRGESETKPRPPAEAPKNCRVWFDGCNNCTRAQAGGLLACTKKFCLEPQEPMCRQYFEENSSGDSDGTAGGITDRPTRERELPIGEQREQSGASVGETSREMQPAKAPFSLTDVFNRFPQWLVHTLGRWF